MSDHIGFIKEIREIVSGITQSNIDFQKEITQSNIDFQKEITQSNSDLQKKITQSNSDFQKKITQSNSDFQKKITQSNIDFQKEIHENNIKFQDEIHTIVSGITKNNSDFQKKIHENNSEFQNEIWSTVSGISKTVDNCSTKIDLCHQLIGFCNARIDDLQLEIDVLKNVAALKSEKDKASTSAVVPEAKDVENPPEKNLPKTETKAVPVNCGMRQLDETDKNAPNERKLKADKEDKASTSAVVPEAKDVENPPEKNLPKTETKAVPVNCGMRQLDETDKNAPNERKLKADKEDKASTSAVVPEAKDVENPPEKNLPKTETKAVPVNCGMRQLDETDKNAPNERKLKADKEDKASTSAVVPEVKDVENQPKKHLPKTETKAAKSCEETIVLLIEHLNEFGLVADGVFVILENLAKEKGKEYAKKVQDMKTHCSNIIDFKIKPDDADSIRRGLRFLNMPLKEFGRDTLDRLKKNSDGLTEEANSQIENLRRAFSALKIAFDNAIQKYPHASCSDSPVLLGRVDHLQVRAIASTKNSIKVEWYPISGGIIDNVTINKYVLHHRRRFQSDEWFTTERAPQNEAFNVELRPLHPASKYEFYISAFGGKGKELRKSRHVCATTKSD
ncbi:hypothetical protein niasHS_010407 [Heterodera schachtii]|uniref:Fibronectin type-III domain-containing protein n=1 Tax=Heterodera schachtii TaxID=97005 RepID=A0ABD2J6Z2_HETSC